MSPKPRFGSLTILMRHPLVRLTALSCLFASWLFSAGTQQAACAQDTVELLRLIEQAEASLDVDSLPDAESRENLLVEAIERVRQFFATKTDSDNHDQWMEYLKLDELSDGIQDEESISVRGRAAVALAGRLRGPEVGLELTRLIQLRKAVDAYIVALKLSNPDRAITSLEKQLGAIAELIAPKAKDESTTGKQESGEDDTETSTLREIRSIADLSAEETAQLNSLVTGLADANQANDLVRRLRSRFAHSNFRVQVDGRLITDSITQAVDKPNAVNDCILGTRVVGNARVQGAVTAQLLPTDGYIRLLVRTDGRFTTSTRGYNGPVSLDTSGIGSVYAARQIAITERKIVLGDPIATADVSTTINRINHRWRLVRRIAAKKAAESKPQAEEIARQKLKDQVLDEFTRETSQTANRKMPDIDGQMSPWLKRLDLPSPQRTLSSTNDAIIVTGKLQRPSGLAAPSVAPHLSSVYSASGNGVLPGGYVASVQIHESFVSTMIDHLLAGENFTPDKLQDLMAAFGVKPDADSNAASQDSDSEEEADFEVDFASFRPVFIEARSQTLRIGVRGNRFAQGDRELKRPLEVAATYRPAIQTDGTMILIRDEDIDLSFPGGRRLTITQTAIKANIEEGFDKLFPDTLLHRPINVPSTVEFPALAGKTFRVCAIDLQNGWVTVAIR